MQSDADGVGPRGSTGVEHIAVEVGDLRMRYGDRDVLDGVSFEVHRGEVVCLLGPNGAGKTTTIEILQGFRMRSAGRVRLLGVDPADGNEDWRARVGVVLQSWRDHARWTPRRLLAHLGELYRPYGTPERPRPRDPDELLAEVGLTDVADQRTWTLSGGQRRRLDVAVGIVGRPEVLFLDEPTGPFDPHARREFHHLIRRLVSDESTTVLLTTHDLDEAQRIADRILILADGRIVADGTPADLARRLGAETTVSWTHGGRELAQATTDPTSFLRRLLADHRDGIEVLHIHRPSLEDTYLAMTDQPLTGTAPVASATTKEPR